MSFTLTLDPLTLLLDDPALIAGLRGVPEPDLAPPVSGLAPAAPAAAPAPVPDAAEPAPAPVAADPEPPIATPPAFVFPTSEDLAAILADSYAPPPGIDAALRAELAETLGLDPALIDDEDAFMAALAALPPPPQDELPDPISDEPAWRPAWFEPAPADWPLG